MITQVVQCFWKRWKSDYLNTLMQRTKWTTPSRNIQVNDVVVTRIMPGHDGVVRVVAVRTARGNELTRPASKLSILPLRDLEEW